MNKNEQTERPPRTPGKAFEIVRKDLEQATKSTHPRKYDLYDIFCAVLYLIKEGCSWRAIPHDFPKWENVRYHYDIWSKEDDNGISLLDKVLRKLVEAEREKELKGWRQAVRTTFGWAKENQD